MTTLTLYSHCPHCDFPRDRARPFEYSCGSSDFGNRSRECELRTEVDRLEIELQAAKIKLASLAAAASPRKAFQHSLKPGAH